jgi:glycosyltransferase involved in cell wall biosynthesis
MKLVIQIPAFNEEAMLPQAIASLPRRVAGFSEVEVLVVDDGSTDRTSEVARAGGADRVVRLPAHRGLAAAFSTGLEEAIAMGADVVVNFDADLQYDAADIPALVAPILAGSADLVVGDRGPGTLEHFSPGKRLLQRIGSWAVRQASGLEVSDAASGNNKTITVTLPTGGGYNFGNTVRYRAVSIDNATGQEYEMFDYKSEPVSNFPQSFVVPVPEAGGVTIRVYINDLPVVEQTF